MKKKKNLHRVSRWSKTQHLGVETLLQDLLGSLVRSIKLCRFSANQLHSPGTFSDSRSTRINLKKKNQPLWSEVEARGTAAPSGGLDGPASGRVAPAALGRQQPG